MGSSQSVARTVTIENSNRMDVIDLSDAVVQRLNAGLKASSAEEKSKRDQENIPPVGTPKQHQQSSSPPPPPPQIIYHSEMSPTSVEVHRQKERELLENDTYWRKRFALLETNVQKTNEALEHEFEETMEDVRKRFKKAPPSHRLPICQNEYHAVLNCYKQNASTTLLCAPFVHEFNNCIDGYRVKVLDGKADVDQNNNEHNE